MYKICRLDLGRESEVRIVKSKKHAKRLAASWQEQEWQWGNYEVSFAVVDAEEEMIEVLLDKEK